MNSFKRNNNLISQMTLNSKELLSLNKEELLDSFGWIDWRGAPDEIFDTFAS